MKTTNHTKALHAEFFGGKDTAARREAVAAAHDEALLLNELRDFRIDPPDAEAVAKTRKSLARTLLPAIILTAIGSPFAAQATDCGCTKTPTAYDKTQDVKIGSLQDLSLIHI